MMMVMLSGLQKQVLSLYRKALRVAISKGPEYRDQNVAFVRAKFREGANSVDRKDFRTIEFMLRQGEKKLKTYSKPGVSKVATVHANKHTGLNE